MVDFWGFFIAACILLVIAYVVGVAVGLKIGLAPPPKQKTKAKTTPRARNTVNITSYPTK